MLFLIDQLVVGWGAILSLHLYLPSVPSVSPWTAVLAKEPLIASKHAFRFQEVFVFNKAKRCSRFKQHSLPC